MLRRFLHSALAVQFISSETFLGRNVADIERRSVRGEGVRRSSARLNGKSINARAVAAFTRRLAGLSANRTNADSVMVTASQYSDLVVVYLVHESMHLIDASGPATLELVS